MGGWGRWVILGVRAAVACLALIPAATRQAPAAVQIAIVTSREIPPYQAAREGFLEVLERQQVDFRVQDFLAPTDRGQKRSWLQQLRASRPDLILTIGSAATEAVSQDVRDIPVVFSLVLEDHGGNSKPAAERTNVTGASMQIPLETQFRKLREALPSARRFGVLFNPEETGRMVEDARRVAGTLGVELVPIPVGSQADVLDRMEEIAGRVDLLWSVADPTVFTPQTIHYILLSTLRQRIPFIGLSPSYVKAGALLSLSCDYRDVGRQSGELALQVLHGAAPRSVPVTLPRTVAVHLNLNTARQLDVLLDDGVRAGAELISGS